MISSEDKKLLEDKYHFNKYELLETVKIMSSGVTLSRATYMVKRSRLITSRRMERVA